MVDSQDLNGSLSKFRSMVLQGRRLQATLLPLRVKIGLGKITMKFIGRGPLTDVMILLLKRTIVEVLG